MLWYVRLGRASLNYLRRVQKLDGNLKIIKFNNYILEYEICIMAKMDTLPFRRERSRNTRPLQRLHRYYWANKADITPRAETIHSRF